MSSWFIYSIGFAAQLLYFGRAIIQWLLSEKNKKVETPSIFWKLSLMGSILMFIYGYFREDFAIMLGQSLTYFIYIRNLHFQQEWKKLPILIRLLLLAFPLFVVIFYFNNNRIDVYHLFHSDNIATWLLIWGSVAQIIFTMRFVYQWILTEKYKISSLPKGFWILSLVGSLMILFYAILRKDPVLFLGTIFSVFLYIRNLIILKNQI
ncbi:MAG: lipid-A-disaccharide synthase N-terminal domain-containing protein [Flavobacteriaceae bacterium]|nr:lipid-A-disaccharide synthase N-terminal domain-containing protein [Flavobacteriaceae bacterium]